MINLLGEHHFNQIFLTDLFVPDNRLFGEIGNGWRQVSSELAFERSGPDRFLVLFKLLTEMVRVAGPDPDRATAAALGRLVSQLATLRRMSLSIAGMLQEGLQPLTEAAVTKDLGTRYEQDLPVVARQLFPAEPELEAVDTYVSMLARGTAERAAAVHPGRHTGDPARHHRARPRAALREMAMRDETRMLLESMNRLFEDHCTKAVADGAETGTFPDGAVAGGKRNRRAAGRTAGIRGRGGCRVVRSVRRAARRGALRRADTAGGDDAGGVGGFGRRASRSANSR